MRRRRFLALFAVVASVVLALLGGWFVIDRTDAPTAATPQPSVTPEPSTTPTMGWVDVHGVALPVSARHGPARVDGARSSGFAKTEAGAAIAAAHLLTRVSPSAGPAACGSPLATGPPRASEQESAACSPPRTAVAAQVQHRQRAGRTPRHLGDGAAVRARPPRDARTVALAGDSDRPTLRSTPCAPPGPPPREP